MRTITHALIVLALLLPGTVSAVTLQQHSLIQQGNTVTQTFLISRPTTIPLSFSYCNGQSCGNPEDPDLACYVNLYNPNFADGFPDTITISPLGNGQPAKVFLKDGNLAGIDLKYGYYDSSHTNDWNKAILRAQPAFNADGSVTLQFNQGPIQAFKNFTKSPSGRVCGITEEQLANFKTQYGTTFDNVNSAAMKVSIVWRVENPQYANPFDQTVTINGSKQGFQPVLQSSPSPMTPQVTPQADSRLTVPAATSTLLDNLYGTTPKLNWLFQKMLGAQHVYAQSTDVIGGSIAYYQQSMTLNGVVDASGQIEWKNYGNYLKNVERLSVQEVDVATMLQSLDTSATQKQFRSTALGLAALTLKQPGKPDQEGAVVIFGSDQEGNLIVGNPSVNSATPLVMPYEEFLEGNPWTLLISRQ